MKNREKITKYGVKKMLSISTIKTYMFCPLKLYFQSEIDEIYDEEEYFIPKTLKDLRIDIQDLLHKNLRLVKKDMELKEIEETLSKEVFNQIETTFEIIEELKETKKEKEEAEKPAIHKDSNIEFLDGDRQILNASLEDNDGTLEDLDNEEDEIKKLKDEIIDEVNLNLKILSLKASQAMKNLEKDGNEIQNLFFQSSMYNTLIRDLGIDLIGVIDKIEVEKGKYFPILLKTSNPPSKGVWQSDEIELIANALLVEGEFNTYITVGFVEYLKIGERRPIVIDTFARKKFFKLLTKINKIVEDGEIPHVKTSVKKCRNCEYRDLCEKA